MAGRSHQLFVAACCFILAYCHSHQASPEVLLSFPVFLDGHQRIIEVIEGQGVKETVAKFFQQHHVASTHVDAVTREVRRKLAEEPRLVERVMEEDRIQVATAMVDVGEGQKENATFVLDGREEVQVLQWCNDRGLGPVCVSGILKGLAQEMRHRHVNKQVTGQSAPAEASDEQARPAMLVVPILLNGRQVNMVGYEGQTVAEVNHAVQSASF